MSDNLSLSHPAACPLPFPAFCPPCRLHQLSAHLSGRESELEKLQEQLQAEVGAASAKAAAQQAEIAGERQLLSKQAAALDSERESFKAWAAERKQEMAEQHKVGASRSLNPALPAKGTTYVLLPPPPRLLLPRVDCM